MSDPGRAEQAMDGDQHDETSGRQGASSIKSPALAGAGRLAAGRWSQNTHDAGGFVSSAVLTCANALPGRVAFNFAFGRLTSETTVASAHGRSTVGLGAGYFDLAPSTGPFEYDDPGRSGIKREAERDKGRRKDDKFQHLRRWSAVLEPANVQNACFEADLVPTKVHQLSHPQAVPVG